MPEWAEVVTEWRRQREQRARLLAALTAPELLTRDDLALLVGDLVGESPAGGLAAVRHLRLQLERFERAHVATARRHGWSWAEIARVLGRHRQAVHRQYAGQDED